MHNQSRSTLADNLILPTLLFASLGAMTWAVRGCSGFGAWNGCIFAGVTWGAAWWFISRTTDGEQVRPYRSAWIILALLIGIGYSGNRGWMQWASFFEGRLQTNYAAGQFVPISQSYGFLWLFIAGVPWAGLGACLLAWCGSHSRAGAVSWVLRLAMGLGVAWGARAWYESSPEFFLPLYDSLRAQYADLQANPNLRRLINDNREAITHLGLFTGLALAEVMRRDWRNVTLILTVGLLNGAGWALCQNWKWALRIWPGADFNFWRCWESSGGISIGIAYGVAFYFANRPMGPAPSSSGQAIGCQCPNLERLAAYLGVILGLGISLKNGLKGWANIYIGKEEYWDNTFSIWIAPFMLAALVPIVMRTWLRPLPANFQGDPIPHAYRLMWVVLITQHAIAQLVTGPRSNWSEMAFSLYYILLFLISAVILHYYQRARPAASTSVSSLRKLTSSAEIPA